MWRALAALLMLAPAALAAEPAWIAERGERAAWRSSAVGRPVALARAARTPEPISVNVQCTIESDAPVLCLHYRDADRIADREWQSQPLPGWILTRMRAGSFLVLERPEEARLRLSLHDARGALDALGRMCSR